MLRVPIGVGGSFAVTARSGARSLGVPRVPVSVRGVFDGTSVKGRVTLTTGPWFVYERCKADARFHAKIAR